MEDENLYLKWGRAGPTSNFHTKGKGQACERRRATLPECNLTCSIYVYNMSPLGMALASQHKGNCESPTQKGEHLHQSLCVCMGVCVCEYVCVLVWLCVAVWAVAVWAVAGCVCVCVWLCVSVCGCVGCCGLCVSGCGCVVVCGWLD